jgi:hypothetical protein
LAASALCAVLIVISIALRAPSLRCHHLRPVATTLAAAPAACTVLDILTACPPAISTLSCGPHRPSSPHPQPSSSFSSPSVPHPCRPHRPRHPRRPRRPRVVISAAPTPRRRVLPAAALAHPFGGWRLPDGGWRQPPVFY